MLLKNRLAAMLSFILPLHQSLLQSYDYLCGNGNVLRNYFTLWNIHSHQPILLKGNIAECSNYIQSLTFNFVIINGNSRILLNSSNGANEQTYTVWNCPFCTLKNDINWNKCDGCECQKPPSNQVEISYSYIKPKKLNKN